MIQAVILFLDIDIDWEMGIDISHFVLVSLCDADDQVVDNRSYGAECRDVLPRAMVDLYLDHLLALCVFREGETNGNVGEVFCEFACRFNKLVKRLLEACPKEGLSEVGWAYHAGPQR